MRRTSVLTREELLADNWIEVPCTSSIVVPADTGRNFFLLLTQNCSIGITAPTSGKRIRLRVQQDSVGSRTLTADGTFQASLTITSTADAVTWVELQYNDVTKLWEQISTGGGAPTTADYLVKTADAGLSAERVVTDTATVTWDWSTAGQAKATAVGVNGGATTTVYGANSTAAVYIDANGIGAYISGKPVSVWYGSLLSVDAAISVGAVGTSGFTKSNSGASGNFDCVYNGTTIWRIPDTSTFHLVDVNLKLGVTTGTKIGTTTSQKLGFWNATPVAQPSAIADATDAASTMARLNDVLAMLRTLGIIAP